MNKEDKCCGECVRFGQDKGSFALADCLEETCSCHKPQEQSETTQSTDETTQIEQSEESWEILQIVNKAATVGLRIAGRVWLQKRLHKLLEQAKKEERDRIVGVVCKECKKSLHN